MAREDRAYAVALGDLPDPPPALFALGDPSLVERPLAAIVGTRDATPYGVRVARLLARTLAGAGVGVVSGMARGIDAAAHLAALEAGGTTIAVLGTGVDVPYPASHRGLHRRIAERGLLLSELPCGARATKWSFPRRNRLIAALSRITIVVEAGERSGALITAAYAGDLGRVVAAVPGPFDAPTSRGTNLLLRDGAQVVASVEDALALAGVEAPPPRPRASLSADEAAVFDALAGPPLTSDQLLTRTGLPVARCAAALGTLEIAGLVESGASGEFRRAL